MYLSVLTGRVIPHLLLDTLHRFQINKGSSP